MTAAAMPWDWRDSAACLDQDPELWFPIGEKSRDALLEAAAAKAICSGCPVQVECVTDAGDYGIWGGLTEDERRSLKRRGERVKAKERKAAPHGTEKRYRVHLHAREPACEPCLKAAALARHDREYPTRGNIVSASGTRRVT